LLASLFQVLIGASGILGILLNFIGPLAIAPTIALVGISLFGPAAGACEGQWWIAIA
jgi:nucleobase transporter 1/2